jgi:hypothetical protein
MRKISAKTNIDDDSWCTYRDRAEIDRRPEGDGRITSVTGRGYKDTMRTYYETEEEARIRERKLEREREREREREIELEIPRDIKNNNVIITIRGRDS